VIGNLVVFPSGELAETSLILRLSAVAIGFAVYLVSGNRMLVGILTAEAVLIAGMLLSP
jgi:hypothetical protein